MGNETAGQEAARRRAAERDRDIVGRAFNGWARGGDGFFDIRARCDLDHRRNGPSARAYRGRQDYLDNSIRPRFERLSAPPAPHIRQIWAEEDSVVVRWDSDATALGGEPYRNSYAWFFTVRDGQVIEAPAFLDLPAYGALIDRVKPRQP
jgi:ketosteroid isomerase-like protein